jgi:hypothetical protein
MRAISRLRCSLNVVSKLRAGQAQSVLADDFSKLGSHSGPAQGSTSGAFDGAPFRISAPFSSAKRLVSESSHLKLGLPRQLTLAIEAASTRPSNDEVQHLERCLAGLPGIGATKSPMMCADLKDQAGGRRRCGSFSFVGLAVLLAPALSGSAKVRLFYLSQKAYASYAGCLSPGLAIERCDAHVLS